MPSPFPGMDPFLEAPAFFHGVHTSLVAYLREALQPLLPEPYYAELGERTWTEIVSRPAEPDVVVSLDAAQPVLVTVPHAQGREVYLNVYTRLGDSERVVATIEVLSPANKTPGERGRELYLKKQREVLDGQVHLVEIDLLRGGTHSTAVPLDWLRDKVPAHDYHACVHRFDNLEDFFIYPAVLEGRLPTIDVPLLPGDGSVRVDLQAAFDRAYDTGPYRRRVRYAGPVPPPALSAERSAWVAQRLRTAGLLPG